MRNEADLAAFSPKASMAFEIFVTVFLVFLNGFFVAAEFAMDHLTSESWFWKRERAQGAWRWVEPRQQDFADLERWQG